MSLALELPQSFNVAGETIRELIPQTVELFQKQSLIPEIFAEKTLNSYQETYSEPLGFGRFTSERTDMSAANLNITKDGFTYTKSYRMFDGSFGIAERLIFEGQAGQVANLTTKATIAFERDLNLDAVVALTSGFGNEVWTPTVGGRPGYSFMLLSSDTVNGKTGLAGANSARNPLFTNQHTIVKAPGMQDTEFLAKLQSNKFAIGPVEKSATFTMVNGVPTAGAGSVALADITGIDIGGSDAGQVAKLGSIINKICTYMENLLDDNGQRIFVNGSKKFIIAKDPILEQAFDMALNEQMLRGEGDMSLRNQGFKRATVFAHPYLNDCPALATPAASGTVKGIGAFVIDLAFNAGNNGLELSTRRPVQVKTVEFKDPNWLKVIFEEWRDFNCGTWQGSAYLFLGAGADIGLSASTTTLGAIIGGTETFTVLMPVATVAKNVNIVNTATNPVQTHANP